MQPDFDDYRWLVSSAAVSHLQAVATDVASPALVTRLRRELSPAQAHLVLELAELRRRAQSKFANAKRMFFTRRALEQASDESISAYKAARFTSGVDAASMMDMRLADLCCGIGGDLLAMAACGGSNVLAVDADPIAALLAEANLAVLGLQDRATVAVGDAAQTNVAELAAWHADPDRRVEGRRTTRLAAFAPSLEQLQSLLAQNPHAAIKLAPASELPKEWETDFEREWIGSQGECRQQLAWGGRLARHPGRRTATVLVASEGSVSSRTIVSPTGSEPHLHASLATSLGRYVFEPHSAVLAAHLDGVLAAQHDLRRLSPQAAYYTSDCLICDLALTAFEIVDVLPFKAKVIAAWLAERGIGRVEVKKRGVDFDPLQLQKQLKGKGGRAAAVIIAPCPQGVRAILANRVASEV